MKLSELIRTDLNVEISDVCIDSREVKKGSLFICIKGERYDGHDFALKALENGASFVICEKDLSLSRSITVCDTKKEAARIFSAFYEHPQKRLDITAVTGTNGKTSSVFMLRSIYEKAGIPCASMGTLGSIYGGRLIAEENTTPTPEVLYRRLREISDNEIKNVAMEISSHAIALGRVEPIAFSRGIHLGVSNDHLDFHKNIEEYAKVKESLFEKCKVGIYNADDDKAEQAYLKRRGEKIRFGFKRSSDVGAERIKYYSDRCEYRLNLHGSVYDIVCRYPGSFGVTDSLAAISAAHNAGINACDIQKALCALEQVPGRMESVYNGEFSVIIDFAHTPDAMLKVLESVRSLYPDNKITLVFGCGGNRDKSKRAAMGSVSRLADKVIITSDNVRYEKGEDIISQIVCENKEATVISDRREAIEYAIDSACAKEIILVLGKGHERYETVNGKKIPFSERDIIEERINGRTKI